MIKIKFSENIKSLRQGQNLNQGELAIKVGVDRRTISAWENGVCIPNVETIAKLCEIFDETFDSILT